VSCADETDLDGRVRKLLDEILRPLLEADGSVIHSVRRVDDTYVVELGGSLVGCPALELVRLHVLNPAFRRALGEPVGVRIEIRPSGPGLTPGPGQSHSLE
jgi:Fe-S cluster biogenesis protein NfuA